MYRLIIFVFIFIDFLAFCNIFAWARRVQLVPSQHVFEQSSLDFINSAHCVLLTENFTWQRIYYKLYEETFFSLLCACVCM